MESTGERIGDAEVLLRRIPPSNENMPSTSARGDGTLRATSLRMRTLPDEDHLSGSLARITSPRQLLDDLQNDGIDPQGWHVCQFRAADVREVGLEVTHTPTPRDPGQCSITANDGLAYPNRKAQKLARRTRVLTDEESDNPPGRHKRR